MLKSQLGYDNKIITEYKSKLLSGEESNDI